MSAADQWRADLAAWAIPDEILAQAPTSPWGFSVAGFRDRAARQQDDPTPGHAVMRAAVPEGGSVLDVGCGGGGASLPLIPPAAQITGVDSSAGMLEVFRDAVTAAGGQADVVDGEWPAIAPQVGPHDVVVAQDVVYNVPDLAGFVRACNERARRRVVLVLPTAHPMGWTRPYWRDLWDLDRPTGPTVDLCAEVVTEALGVVPERTSWTEPTLWSFASPDEALEHVRVRLCLPASRDDDIRNALTRTPPPVTREAWAVWWDPGQGV